MNVVVLSPKNRGVGVTSIAYSLAVELKHRGEFVQLMDVNHTRPSLMTMYKSIKKHTGEDLSGMTNLTQLVRTGTVSAEDMSNCTVDLGVNTICVTPNITNEEMIEIVELTKVSQIEGRNLYTIIDLNIEDSSSELFKEILKYANICIFTLTQDIEHLNNIKSCKQLNDKELKNHNIHTAYVVNRFEECVMSLKDIWKFMNAKDTKNWFKVRYNEHILQIKSKGLYEQFAQALRESNDPDIARVKADISRIASYVLRVH